MSQKRSYDIGGNVIIKDDGFSLIANHQRDEKCSCSIGISRPYVGPQRQEFEVAFSRDGKVFYVKDFADPFQGFWLGLERLNTTPDKYGYATFHRGTPEEYHRIALHFNAYEVKDDAARRGENLSSTHDAVLDYIKLAQPIFDEQERRFNEVIAHTGRDLAWIMSKIGPWVPFPLEPAPIVLSD